MDLNTGLEVQVLPIEDTWKDIVRIDNDSRKDKKGTHIHRGAICRISFGDKSRWVIVHGLKHKKAVIQMDLSTRIGLDVELGDRCNFKLERLSWLRSLWFPWKVSDPIYRVPAQLSLISLFLGIIGLVLGFMPIWDKFHETPKHQTAVFSGAPATAGNSPSAPLHQ